MAAQVRFPFRLHQLLKETEDAGQEEIVSWLPCGRAFKVHDKKKFSKTILVQYFRHGRYKSFLRQLSMYNFQRVREGSKAERGAYKHPYFQKGRVDLSQEIIGTFRHPCFKHQMNQANGSNTKTVGDEDNTPSPVNLMSSPLSWSHNGSENMIEERITELPRSGAMNTGRDQSTLHNNLSSQPLSWISTDIQPIDNIQSQQCGKPSNEVENSLVGFFKQGSINMGSSSRDEFLDNDTTMKTTSLRALPSTLPLTGQTGGFGFSESFKLENYLTALIQSESVASSEISEEIINTFGTNSKPAASYNL